MSGRCIKRREQRTRPRGTLPLRKGKKGDGKAKKEKPMKEAEEEQSEATRRVQCSRKEGESLEKDGATNMSYNAERLRQLRTEMYTLSLATK